MLIIISLHHNQRNHLNIFISRLQQQQQQKKKEKAVLKQAVVCVREEEWTEKEIQIEKEEFAIGRIEEIFYIEQMEEMEKKHVCPFSAVVHMSYQDVFDGDGDVYQNCSFFDIFMEEEEPQTGDKQPEVTENGNPNEDDMQDDSKSMGEGEDEPGDMEDEEQTANNEMGSPIYRRPLELCDGNGEEEQITNNEIGSPKYRLPQEVCDGVGEEQHVLDEIQPLEIVCSSIEQFRQTNYHKKQLRYYYESIDKMFQSNVSIKEAIGNDGEEGKRVLKALLKKKEKYVSHFKTLLQLVFEFFSACFNYATVNRQEKDPFLMDIFGVICKKVISPKLPRTSFGDVNIGKGPYKRITHFLARQMEYTKEHFELLAKYNYFYAPYQITDEGETLLSMHLKLENPKKDLVEYFHKELLLHLSRSPKGPERFVNPLTEYIKEKGSKIDHEILAILGRSFKDTIPSAQEKNLALMLCPTTEMYPVKFYFEHSEKIDVKVLKETFGHTLHVRDSKGLLPVHYYLERKDFNVDIAKEVLSGHEDCYNREGETITHDGCFEKMLLYFLSEAKDPSVKSIATLLEQKDSEGEFEIDLNDDEDGNGVSIFSQFIANAPSIEPDVFKVLLEHRADIHLKTGERTPFSILLKRQDLSSIGELLKVLVEMETSNSTVSLQNTTGKMARKIFENGEYEPVSTLLSKNKNISLMDLEKFNAQGVMSNHFFLQMLVQMDMQSNSGENFKSLEGWLKRQYRADLMMFEEMHLPPFPKKISFFLLFCCNQTSTPSQIDALVAVSKIETNTLGDKRPILTAFETELPSSGEKFGALKKMLKSTKIGEYLKNSTDVYKITESLFLSGKFVLAEELFQSLDSTTMPLFKESLCRVVRDGIYYEKIFPILEGFSDFLSKSNNKQVFLIDHSIKGFQDLSNDINIKRSFLSERAFTVLSESLVNKREVEQTRLNSNGNSSPLFIDMIELEQKEEQVNKRKNDSVSLDKENNKKLKVTAVNEDDDTL